MSNHQGRGFERARGNGAKKSQGHSNPENKQRYGESIGTPSNVENPGLPSSNRSLQNNSSDWCRTSKNTVKSTFTTSQTRQQTSYEVPTHRAHPQYIDRANEFSSLPPTVPHQGPSFQSNEQSDFHQLEKKEHALTTPNTKHKLNPASPAFQPNNISSLQPNPTISSALGTQVGIIQTSSLQSHPTNLLNQDTGNCGQYYADKQNYAEPVEDLSQLSIQSSQFQSQGCTPLITPNMETHVSDKNQVQNSKKKNKKKYKQNIDRTPQGEFSNHAQGDEFPKNFVPSYNTSSEKNQERYHRRDQDAPNKNRTQNQPGSSSQQQSRASRDTRFRRENYSSTDGAQLENQQQMSYRNPRENQRGALLKGDSSQCNQSATDYHVQHSSRATISSEQGRHALKFYDCRSKRSNENEDNVGNRTINSSSYGAVESVSQSFNQGNAIKKMDSKLYDNFEAQKPKEQNFEHQHSSQNITERTFEDNSMEESVDENSLDTITKKEEQHQNSGSKSFSGVKYDKKRELAEKSGRRLKMITDDLFTVSSTTSLAHCVSEDMRMGSGIAVQFRRKFSRVSTLLSQGRHTGEVAVLPDPVESPKRFIYYLVTKARSFEKPTLKSLESSLKTMKQHCVENDIRMLAMPKIGCGLDRLPWSNVSRQIEEIFSDTDVNITIYDFEGPRKEDAVKPKFSFKYRPIRLVSMEKETARVFFADEGKRVDGTMESLEPKFRFLAEYKRNALKKGEVFEFKNTVMPDHIFGLVVKGTTKGELIDYMALEKACKSLSKSLKKLEYVYFAIEAFNDPVDPFAIDKVITIIRFVFASTQMECHVCYPDELSHLNPRGDNDMD